MPQQFDAMQMRSSDQSSVGSVPTVFGDDHQLSPDEERPSLLAQNETKAVFWLKGVVIAVLVIAAVGMGVFVHRFARSKERELFESQFNYDATQLKREYYHSTAQTKWVSIALNVRYTIQAYLAQVSPIYTILVGEFMVAI
jgi:hypothetical protein